MGYKDIYSRAAAENLKRATDEAVNYIEDLQERLDALSGLGATETGTCSEAGGKPATGEPVASEGELRDEVYDYIARYVYGGADSGATERLFSLLERQAAISKGDPALEAENRKLEEARDYWVGQYNAAAESAKTWRERFEKSCEVGQELLGLCEKWRLLYQSERERGKSSLERANDLMRGKLGEAHV